MSKMSIAILYSVSLYVLFFLLSNKMSLIAAICCGTIGGLLSVLHEKDKQ